MYFAVSERTAAAAMAANGNVDKWVEISQQCKVEKTDNYIYFASETSVIFLFSIFLSQS